MAPRTKAAQSHLSNLKSDLVSKGGPSPKPSDISDASHARHSFWIQSGNHISRKVTVKDWSESNSETEALDDDYNPETAIFPGNSLPLDPETGTDDLFDFDGSHGTGCGSEEQDDSDLSDSDTESDEEEDAEIRENAILLLFTETLQ
jgi:hypothetical protein